MDRIDTFAGDFAFLSNFFPAEVELDGILYPTVEHAYQAAKTLDTAERLAIRRLDSPGKAKRAGTKVTLRRGWEPMKLDQMLQLLRDKFRRHHDLRERLLATGTAFLAEGNRWGDTYWGQVNGRGENQLGRLLMMVRAELMAELAQ